MRSKTKIQQNWAVHVSWDVCEVSLSLTRCVKYNRMSMEGGMTSQNVSILLAQCSDVVARLGTCTRVVRAVIPPSKTKE